MYIYIYISSHAISLSLSLHIYIYIYIHTHIYVYLLLSIYLSIYLCSAANSGWAFNMLPFCRTQSALLKIYIWKLSPASGLAMVEQRSDVC